MATTVIHKVFKHHKKDDGTYNVKCVIYHNKSRSFVSTPYSVTDRQLYPDLTIKDKKVLASIVRDEELIHERLNKLGILANAMTVKELVDQIYHQTNIKDDVEVDFYAFSILHIEQLKADGREGSANTLATALNNLSDFFGGVTSISINSINANVLRDFERFLSRERKQVRPKNGGGWITKLVKPLGPGGIHRNMRDLRILFNAARGYYNTEFKTVINHYPFDFYKVPKPTTARKKGDDLTAKDIQSIAGIIAPEGSILELSRDLFLLSLYLCGMNAKDIYEFDGKIKKGRIEYERSKTKGRRSDRAFISIKVSDQAKPIIEKYCKGQLKNRYSNISGLHTALHKGLKKIAEMCRIEALTFYHARHTFATTAHRDCGYSTADVARALNHVDNSHKVTAGYIAYDWSIIDKMQKDVLVRLGL
jgi:integrase